MSKPKPFVNSFWGILLILAIVVITLGVSNYQTNRAGFMLPHQTIDIQATHPKSIGAAAYFINNITDFNSLFKTSDSSALNLTKQVGLVYPDPSVGLESVIRQGSNLLVRYNSNGGDGSLKLVTIDRTKLISSSQLTIDFLIDNQIKQSIQINPDQI